MAEALRPVGRPAERVLDHMRSGGVAIAEELFYELQQLLESLALERPLIVHVDDLQWAEPMLLDMLDHITDLSRGAPILLLCTARPELLEDRPGWGGGKLNATTLLLKPLGAADCEQLLDQLGDGLLPELRSRVIATSEGNPLFLEETVALVRERGTLAVPSTIRALLAARLERLPTGERELLEYGAIEGEIFHLAPLRALAGEGIAVELEPWLAGLVRKELIRRHLPTLHGEDAFRFRHMLVRDAACSSISKVTRARLHQRFATWLKEHGSVVAEVDEIVGWHLEQAVRYQRELRRTADPLVARSAAEHLCAAGRRASARSDAAAATNLLKRAHALASDESSLRRRIGVDLAEQLLDGDDFARVDDLLSVAEGDPETAAAAALVRLQWLHFAGGPKEKRMVESTLPSVIEHLREAGDERGQATAHMAAVLVNLTCGRFKAAGEAAHLAAEHAARAGDEGLRARAVAWYVGSLVYGPDHAEEVAQELDALESEDLGPYVSSFVEHARGELARLAGRFDEARALKRSAIEHFRALGVEWMAGDCLNQLALVEMDAGQPASALAVLLESDAALAASGEQSFRSTTQATLAWVYEALGDEAAAREAIALAEALGGPEDVLNYAITHAVRARIALRTGDGESAERWARSAVQHAFQMDSPGVRGDTQLTLARVLMALGRETEAGSSARVALDVYRARGDLHGATEAGVLLEELRTSS